MKNISSVKIFFLVIFSSVQLFSQTSPKPDLSEGINATQLISKTYYFYYNSIPIYSFELVNNNGTFSNLKAYDNAGQPFLPSINGGPIAFLNNQIVNAWTPGVSYNYISDERLSGDTILVKYQMNYLGDYFKYNYKFYISGRTLIIKVEANNDDSGSKYKGAGVDLVRCENAINAKIIRVPYLTLLNLLLSNNGLYTSMFFDWEKTNASTYFPRSEGFSSTSVHYAPYVEYFPKTDGTRNLINETIYLTTSTDINYVLPNLVGPTAPYKTEAASKTVFTYWPPYTWILKPDRWHYNRTDIKNDPRYTKYSNYIDDPGVIYNGNYKLFHLLHKIGVRGLNVIVKKYQFAGFDRQLPSVLQDAGGFKSPALTGMDGECPQGLDSYLNGGKPYMDSLRVALVNTLSYGFGLHEQYVDIYTNAVGWYTINNVSKDSYGLERKNWNTNCPLEAPPDGYSRVIKPTLSNSWAYIWSSSQYLGQFNPTFSYLDVHSAINPSLAVDFDYSYAGAGKLRTVIEKYRTIPDILRLNYSRTNYNVPIQGEGGEATMLYVGYFDDLEARVQTADQNLIGVKAPIFVDFDLKKMHSKSALHGVGHIEIFYGDLIQQAGNPNTEETLAYIATELAYGHSGLITKLNEVDHTIEQAVLEYTHVYPFQGIIANSSVNSIQYYKAGVGPYSASEYIKLYPGWDNIYSNDFMSQVKITYTNGIIICVNRHPNYSWNINLGKKIGWFSWHAGIDGGQENLFAGLSDQPIQSTFTLPSKNGWVVFVPIYLMKEESLGETKNDNQPGEFGLEINYPNPFNPSTLIKYRVPQNSLITLKVYDILGKEVAQLVNGPQKAGEYTVTFDGSKLASGVYIYRLTSDKQNLSKKMILIK